MNTENHYQETDLGNIAPNPRGEYSESETYEYLDYVYYQGGSYLCLAELGATITGVAPEPGKITEHWQVITMPGDLTPEYVAMHDRVVNLSEQVEADAEEVRTAEQNISGIEENIIQMQEYTRQSAESAEQSKDSAAGYAASADASRRAAAESEQNVNAQVSGFDVHVEEKTSEAESDIEAARIAANKAILAQQEQSVGEVARVGGAAVSEAQAAAQVATEKASAAAESEKNAKASETATKLSEKNAAQSAKTAEAEKEAVKAAGTEQIAEVNKEGAYQIQLIKNKGSSQVSAVANAGTEQIQAVVDEGVIQMKKVEDKADEVLDIRPQVIANTKALGGISFSINETDGGLDITV